MAFSDGRCERAFERDGVLLDRVDGGLGDLGFAVDKVRRHVGVFPVDRCLRVYQHSHG